VVVHCAVEVVLEVAGLDVLTEDVFPVAVWEVPVLDAAAEVVLPVVVWEAAVLGAAVEVVFVVVAVDAPGFDVVVEVLFPVVVLDTPVLAVVLVVFWVVVGAVGVCVGSVCAKRIAAETKLQTKMMIERFMVRPFEDIQANKVSRPRRQFKNCARSVMTHFEAPRASRP
jgi:hypothetical protein